MPNAGLADYANPPVIEVACGIQFEELVSLQAVHLGSLWSRLRETYDHTREVAPLATAIEAFGEQRGFGMSLSDVPPMARTWFLTTREDGILQVQRDRFLHNWKKVTQEDEYPRYDSVIEVFRERLRNFEEFLNAHGLGPITPLQYEMTYVNHIPQGAGWRTLAEIGNVFPDFSRAATEDRFLPDPDQVNWRTSFPLPGQQGRLHATIRHLPRGSSGTPLLYFELTARGIPSDPSRDAMWAWFDLAHTWIVRGFTDLTSERVRREVWRQTA